LKVINDNYISPLATIRFPRLHPVSALGFRGSARRLCPLPRWGCGAERSNPSGAAFHHVSFDASSLRFSLPFLACSAR